MGFSKNFLWGAATASAQIEGGYNEDGRGASIWDVATEGRVQNGATPHNACMHYHHYQQDVELMRQIGLKAYRFSISWSRIYPQGFGEVNQKGVHFYNNLINLLVKNGIKPVITLYHWDMPQAVLDRGGWLNPDCAKWFADYCAKIVELFSDRVDMFITLNEPECIVDIGYNSGGHAPFMQLPYNRVLEIMHAMLLANGSAVRAMRDVAKQPIKIGIAPSIWSVIPATNSKEDVKVARESFFKLEGKTLGKGLTYALTVHTGRYPQSLEEEFGSCFSHSQEDMKIIHAPLDFFAYNIYSAQIVRAGKGGAEIVPHSANTAYSVMNWAIVPDCLYWSARFLYERFNLPIYITENGVATVDIVGEDGKVNDDARIEYIRGHVGGLQRAVEEGVPVEGYFYWSLMDNFEWSCGYTRRFGLIYVDYSTQKRTLKKSAYYYGGLISRNGLN